MRAAAPGTSSRDLRLDFFRGVALICIFIDHIPGDYLNYFTLSAVGFFDAAEVFIFISGFTAALVYGRIWATRGALIASVQVLRRAWQLYVAHIFLFVIFIAEVSYTVRTFNNPMYNEEMGVGDFLEHPHIAVIQALALQFQPTFLDILPLYIVLLLIFPALLLCLRRQPLLAGHEPDGQREDRALDDAGVDVPELERLVGLGDVAGDAQVERRETDDHSPDDAHEIGDQRQEREREDQREDPGQNEVAHRPEAHRPERVDLLRHLHRPELGGERRARSAAHDDRRHQRGKLAGHRQSDEVGDEDVGAELLELDGPLEGHHEANLPSRDRR